jgi:hypothetical protein
VRRQILLSTTWLPVGEGRLRVGINELAELTPEGLRTVALARGLLDVDVDEYVDSTYPESRDGAVHARTNRHRLNCLPLNRRLGAAVIWTGP